MNPYSVLNGERKALGADNQSAFTSAQTHALLMLKKNDKVSVGTGGSTYQSTFNESNDNKQYQTFEGILLMKLWNLTDDKLINLIVTY